MKNSVRLALWALACLILGSASVNAQTINITTVVGGGPAGLTPTAASIGSPVAVRRDSQNNAYILDNTLGRVLKIDHTTGLMSVYAGNGTVGFSGDTHAATSAQMNGPSGMCFDSNDNLFIADSDNAVIRVVIGPGAVTPPSLTGPVTAGNIYTAVGIPTSTNPVFGGDGTSALTSHLHFPDGCSFDSHGNLYIADRGNNEVRVVIGTAAVVPPGMTGPLTPGFIYRFAGAAGGSFPNPPAGGYSPDGTVANVASIYGPFDVFVDGNNNVFIADLGNNFGADGTPNTQTGQPLNNNVIREVLASDGTIHTVAGVAQTYPPVTGPVASGVATAVPLNEPKGLSVDSLGNLYFCDTISQVIRKVAGGNISVYAGTLGSGGYSGDNGLATSGKISFPAGTFVDTTGNLFISDDVNNAIREVPAVTGGGMTALDIYTIAGNGHLSFGGDNATPTAGLLNTPAGLATDAAGDILVADSANDLIRKVSGAPAKLSTIAGLPEANGFLNNPIYINGALGVATDSSGNVYIADTANCIVRKLASTGITTIAGVEPTNNNPNNPSAITPHCGFDAAGSAAAGTHIGSVGSVAVDSNGNVFFSDKTNSVIWEVPVTTAGSMVANNAYIVAGKTTAGFSGDGGPANAAQLSGPTGIYIDIYNNLFIADAGNHRIREVPAINVGTTMTAGFIYTIAGNGTSGNTGDGAPAINAELATPFAIAVDSAENVFFSDTTNQTIREIAGMTAGGQTAGDIYTVAGTKNAAGFSGDGGLATSAKFNGPQGLALQANASPSTTANLLVSDSGNNRVRSISNIGNNAAALASLSPNPLTFTTPQTVGVASTAAVITLTNGGGATLNVTGVTIGGTNAGDFKENDNCVTPGTVPAGGTCTINVVFTPASTGARTATLTVADSAFGGSQTVTLNGTGASPTPPALTLTVKDTDASPSQTVTAGATATYNLSVTSNQTSNVTAAITCAGAPTAATCSAAPASVTVAPTTGGTFKVSVTTTARGELLPFNQPSTKFQPPSFLQIAPMASIALLFLIAMMLGWMQNEAGRARTLRVALSLVLILMPIAAATVLVGCGGGGGSTPPPPATGTPAGTYTLTVTATSGSTTANTTLTLVVN